MSNAGEPKPPGARKGAITLHEGDLPAGIDLGPVVALDTEAMGLNPHRDRLCLVQLSSGDGDCHIVRITQAALATRLKAMLASPTQLKLIHFARFDVGMVMHRLGVVAQPIYCTKIASKLTRTYTDRHGLKDLCRDLLGVELSKEQQTSDWGSPNLTEAQLRYAASDVLHLHALKAKLDEMLVREGRVEIANACFRFLPARAALDLMGYEEPDIFAH